MSFVFVGGSPEIQNIQLRKKNRVCCAGENGLHRKIRLYLQHRNICSFGAQSQSKHHQYIWVASFTTKALWFGHYSLELHWFLITVQWSHTAIFLHCCSLHQHDRHTSSSTSGTVFICSFCLLAPVAIKKLNVSTACHLITLLIAKKWTIHTIWMDGWMMNEWNGWVKMEH